MRRITESALVQNSLTNSGDSCDSIVETSAVRGNSETMPTAFAPMGWPLHALAVALLAGGCLNGFAARIVGTWPAGGMPSLPWFGLSPIELFAAFVAVSTLRSASDEPWPRPGIAELLTLALVLLPSSTVSWLASGAYAAYGCFRFPRSARAGAALFVGLALTQLWAATILAWYTPEITAIEAKGVAAILSLLRDDIVQSANMVGQPDGHTLVILTACSALDALPRVLLGVVAVAAFMGQIDVRRCGFACMAAAAAVLVGNQIRLALMTWSAALYETVHGASGANAFDLLQVGLVLGLGLLASRT